MKASFFLFGFIATATATPLSDRTYRGKHHDESPFKFTSTYSVHVEPKQVVDAMNKFTGGLQGASGVFKYGINSHENVICYNLTLNGFRGEYSSPAKTATHIHEAPVGKAGPPRIAFPNPEGPVDGPRSSIGCLRGPFVTGVKAADGKDTGEGFHVSKIEKNPSAFFTDVHSSLAVPGAVRGQLNGKKRC
ncbi:hypothetical protein QQS21_004182 [Conoideocrella luteorostrata]|uniref:CHRD domain-containing protein n=1 Tax=Conoideocrella luteorostrata TaxID=1105319 RepID=A0AAJ0CUA9_9HYPO|nr:hypothetical protein QQS21_004182 [Conoideocrella luteorostrata]